MRRLVPFTVAIALSLGGAAATPVAAEAAHPTASAHRTYTNPLDLRLPDGQRAENCADPDVARGTGHDRHWYLYCTSDAIDPTEHDASGDPVQHLLPTYRSTDLVHWTYAGDAFASRPSWAASDAGLWAPELQHRGGRWYLYYAASDTTLPGGGSAIGLATAPTLTGPWTDSGAPVVPPADDPANPGTRRATIDPEVLHVGGHDYVYFGSFPGGVFVRRLNADGRTSIASSERRIAISDRYEATNIVRHGGWYWFLGSSTNCCNAGLTGYGVFAARSRSPFGPFRDADGRSILSAKVGGTPVLEQNGDRWIGPGHESYFTDAAGQGWLLYHAVDRTDPVVAGTTDYTKRPALLDRVDWRNGWPVVNGGAGPSDTPRPAPAAQRGQHDASAPRTVHAPAPGRTIAALSDDFHGSTLSPRWTAVRTPAPGSITVSGGALRWATQDADIHPPTTPLAALLTERSPKGDWSVTAKLRTTVPASGSGHDFVQGGVVVYGDDGHYVKLAVSSIGATRQTEFGRQDSSQPAGAPTYGNGVAGPVGSSWTWLRIRRHVVDGAVAFTASTSVDGRHWRTGGTWDADLGRAPRIGLVSMGGAGYATVVDRVVVARAR